MLLDGGITYCKTIIIIQYQIYHKAHHLFLLPKDWRARSCGGHSAPLTDLRVTKRYFLHKSAIGIRPYELLNFSRNIFDVVPFVVYLIATLRCKKINIFFNVELRPHSVLCGMGLTFYSWLAPNEIEKEKKSNQCYSKFYIIWWGSEIKNFICRPQTAFLPIIKVSPQKFDKGNWLYHTPDSNKIMTLRELYLHTLLWVDKN